MFCLFLASNGWQNISKVSLRKGHAEHIHNNCKCCYIIRHSDNIEVEGYDPGDYEELYYKYWGDPNRLRRERYDEIKDERNAKRRAEYKKKFSDNEGPFITIDNRNNEDKKSIIKPKNIIENLQSTEVGREALSIINEKRIQVLLSYGENNLDENGNPMEGYYDPIRKRIKVFVDATKTTTGTAKTVIHEANHSVNEKASQKEEVECRKKELMHEKNTDRLTTEEIKDIIILVRRLYPDLPWEVD